ncbi:hypothetical protein F0562_005485 [Nyssa sinensis]|uniref:Uncharacterized protein n=1 Tax=Nyssa sinensis TaxID=561372 RepID=A0A5J5AMT4_9ASTE|nr:hypothetical protein F0562_005485 [Nyssa sinensis]
MALVRVGGLRDVETDLSVGMGEFSSARSVQNRGSGGEFQEEARLRQGIMATQKVHEGSQKGKKLPKGREETEGKLLIGILEKDVDEANSKSGQAATMVPDEGRERYPKQGPSSRTDVA